jgi:hypothetical protein
MKTTLLLIVASGFLLAACDKSATSPSSVSSGQPENHATGDFDDLMELADSASMMKAWVYSKTQTFPAEAFDVAPPKITVKRVSKDLFDVRAVYEATAKTDLYSFTVPKLVDEGGKTTAYMVTELLDRKGAKKIQHFDCQVRYGPMNRGRTPDKVKWNWEKPNESGDDMEKYQMGWATAETLKINPEGTASSKPDILVRGTPDYLKAAEKHPKIAVSDDQRRKEESEHFDRLLEAMPRKSR